MVIRSPATVMNVIREKPLPAEEIRRFQDELRGMQLYDGDVTGRMDEATRRATSRYAVYLGPDHVFQNAALTEKLLDGLDVFEISADHE